MPETDAASPRYPGIRRRPLIDRVERRDDGPRWRILDPDTAPVQPGADPPAATVYDPDALLVPGLPDAVGARIGAINEVLAEIGLTASVGDDDAKVAGNLRNQDLPDEVLRLAERRWTTRLTLRTIGDGPQAPPDAWVALQQLRTKLGTQSPRIGLDHMVRACQIGGVPYWDGHSVFEGHPYWDGHSQGPASSYGQPGFGGRSPVHLTAVDPAEGLKRDGRPPVVVVPDTGLGQHPWFDGDGVVRNVQYAGLPLGGTDVDATNGLDDGLAGLLDRQAGHGTFIAGLIRQGCPAATIFPIPVMDGDGVVAESALLNVLTLLLLRHMTGQLSGQSELVVDVLSLSLGYYHETAADDAVDTQVAALMEAFAELGVCVVAAAGNDGTVEPLLPAGLARPGSSQEHGLISVAALNPSGTTVAYFSNDGPWVSDYRQGAAIVSTVPTNYNGANQADLQTRPDGLGPRGTVDVDDYTGGFGIWSGTSFAAPIMAAELAALLAKSSDLSDVGVTAMRKRAEQARNGVSTSRLRQPHTGR